MDLWAKSGTLTLADGTAVNIWGYAANSADPAQVPSPALKACAGDTVNITLHNAPGEDSSLAVHGQTLPADMSGAADSSAKTYAFTAHGRSISLTVREILRRETLRVRLLMAHQAGISH